LNCTKSENRIHISITTESSIEKIKDAKK